MKKLLTALVATLVLGTSVSATTLYPQNIYHAEMNDGWELTVRTDYEHSSKGGDENANLLNIPNIDARYTFADRYRVGMNIGLVYGNLDTDGSGDESAFGFSNLGLTLEAEIIEGITAYINQDFDFLHNNALGKDAVFGRDRNAYGFQTGTLLQASLTDHLVWFGNIAYRFDVPADDTVQHSFIYDNGLVWDTGINWFNPSLELLGTTTYTQDVGTNLKIVPGWISAWGEENKYQMRVGMPIGLNGDSTDIGVHLSLFTDF